MDAIEQLRHGVEAGTLFGREAEGDAAVIARIKFAMCRSDGAAPDRSHYDVMAHEIFADLMGRYAAIR